MYLDCIGRHNRQEHRLDDARDRERQGGAAVLLAGVQDQLLLQAGGAVREQEGQAGRAPARAGQVQPAERLARLHRRRQPHNRPLHERALQAQHAQGAQ